MFVLLFFFVEGVFLVWFWVGFGFFGWDDDLDFGFEVLVWEVGWVFVDFVVLLFVCGFCVEVGFEFWLEVGFRFGEGDDLVILFVFFWFDFGRFFCFILFGLGCFFFELLFGFDWFFLVVIFVLDWFVLVESFDCLFFFLFCIDLEESVLSFFFIDSFFFCFVCDGLFWLEDWVDFGRGFLFWCSVYGR